MYTYICVCVYQYSKVGSPSATNPARPHTADCQSILTWNQIINRPYGREYRRDIWGPCGEGRRLSAQNRHNIIQQPALWVSQPSGKI